MIYTGLVTPSTCLSFVCLFVCLFVFTSPDKCSICFLSSPKLLTISMIFASNWIIYLLSSGTCTYINPPFSQKLLAKTHAVWQIILTRPYSHPTPAPSTLSFITTSQSRFWLNLELEKPQRDPDQIDQYTCSIIEIVRSDVKFTEGL